MTTSENTQRTFECDLNNIIKLYKTNQIDEFIKEMKNNVSHNIVSTFFNNDVTSQIDLKKVYTPLMKCYNIVKKGNYKSSVEDVVKEELKSIPVIETNIDKCNVTEDTVYSMMNILEEHYTQIQKCHNYKFLLKTIDTVSKFNCLDILKNIKKGASLSEQEYEALQDFIEDTEKRLEKVKKAGEKSGETRRMPKRLGYTIWCKYNIQDYKISVAIEKFKKAFHDEYNYNVPVSDETLKKWFQYFKRLLEDKSD